MADETRSGNGPENRRPDGSRDEGQAQPDKQGSRGRRRRPRRKHSGNPVDAAGSGHGGDEAGATVLSALADAFSGKRVQMLQVVNPHRPQTSTVSGCVTMRNEIEKAAQLTITGLIGNANLIDETGTEEIYSGYEFVQTVSQESGLPLEFITVSQELLPKIDMNRFSCAVLPIARQLVPPWLKVSEFRN